MQAPMKSTSDVAATRFPYEIFNIRNKFTTIE